MPVRRHLLLLLFSILLPAMLACAMAIFFTYSAERRQSEQNLMATTQALAEALDRQFDTYVLQLQTLAVSPSLQNGDLPAFGRQASQAVSAEGRWVVLVDGDGQQLINTLLPFGEPLPRHGPDHPYTRQIAQAFHTGLPTVSDLFVGPVTGVPTLAVTVPVFNRNHQVIYCLAMGIRPRMLADIVRSTSLPPNWMAGAYDRNLALVARTRDAENFLGLPPVARLGQAMRDGSHGIIDTPSRNGTPTRIAFATSPHYGWHFVLGVPQAELMAPIHRAAILYGAVAVAFLAAGTVLALRIGHGISQSITSLVPAALNLQDAIPSPAQRQSRVAEVGHVLAALTDAGHALHAHIAERDQAERELISERDKVADILSSITDGFYALDRDWRFTFLNSRAQQILGKSQEEVLGRIFTELYPQVRDTPVLTNYATVMAERRPLEFEHISPILKRWTSFSVYPAGDGGIAIYFRDISRQKMVEADLLVAKEEAERASVAKSLFLASASHDLRQPVQALFFLYEVLASSLKDHPCARVLNTMEITLAALKSLLDGLLDISRLHAGTVDLRIQNFSVQPLLRHLVTENAHRAATSDIILRLVDSSACLHSDKEQLERILRNLIDNALKYTPRGGKVLIGCRRRHGTVQLMVLDNGPGIPPEKKDAIFEEFVQLGNPERDRTKGLGLGLAIVRQLGKLMGHEVTVRSQLGRGTCFTVFVPTTEGEAENMEDSQEPPLVSRNRIA